MFGLSKAKIDYEEIFSSLEKTHQHIYGDRSKTVEILGNEDFTDAWLNSQNIIDVCAVILKEAKKGDIPSIKKLIWFYDFFLNEVENKIEDKTEQIQIKVKFLRDRVICCELAIHLGLKDQSYFAMTSCANLYSILSQQHKSMDDSLKKRALNGIILFAKRFLESGHDDHEMIENAKNHLKQYTPIALLG